MMLKLFWVHSISLSYLCPPTSRALSLLHSRQFGKASCVANRFSFAWKLSYGSNASAKTMGLMQGKQFGTMILSQIVFWFSDWHSVDDGLWSYAESLFSPFGSGFSDEKSSGDGSEGFFTDRECRGNKHLRILCLGLTMRMNGQQYAAMVSISFLILSGFVRKNPKVKEICSWCWTTPSISIDIKKILQQRNGTYQAVLN